MVSYTNGKTERRAKIKRLAEESARKYRASTDTVISVDNPFITGANNLQLNAFDVHDGRARILLIEDEIPSEMQTDGAKSQLHAIKWNCDIVAATTITLSAIVSFRQEELNTLNTLSQAIENNINKLNVMEAENATDGVND